MTAPVQTPAPAPVTQAPVVVEQAPETPTARALLDSDNETFAKAFGLATEPPAEVPATPTEPAKAPEPVAVPEPPVVETPAVPEPTLEPEPVKLATEFKLYDPEGELDEADAARTLTVELKANGDTKKLPLDQVVRLAQMGYYNEQREQQVLAAKQFVGQASQDNERLKAENQELQGFFDRAMRDENFYKSAQQNYAAQMSPEARATRAEAQLAELQNGRSQLSADQTKVAFATQVVLPALDRLKAQYPSLSDEALVGRYTLLTAPLQVRGQIAVERLPEVQRIVEQDLAQWAEHVHGLSVKQQSDAAAKQKAAVDKQKVETTLAKRTLARATSPTGTTGAPIREVAKPQTFKSAQDWLDNPNGLAAAVLNSTQGGT